MFNRSTRITVMYCPVEDGEADYDQDCDGCKYFSGMNKDYEVNCIHYNEFYNQCKNAEREGKVGGFSTERFDNCRFWEQEG